MRDLNEHTHFRVSSYIEVVYVSIQSEVIIVVIIIFIIVIIIIFIIVIISVLS